VAKIIKFPEIKKKVVNKFSEILAEAEREQVDSRIGQVSSTFLILFIIGTLVPVDSISTFFSMAVLPAIIIYAVACFRQPFLILRKSFASIAVLMVISVASGCSAGFTFNADQTVLDLCRDEFGNSCRFGESTGISVFGINFRKASIDQALTDAGIEKAFAIDRSWSGGVVRTSKIIVYGG